MATFKFGRRVDIHWNGYDIVGPADTVFSIPDQLYEEFNGDIAPVEPTLVWIDTNEFETLKNNVPSYATAATAPIAINTSTDSAGLTTKTWSLNANYSTTTHTHTGTYQPAGTYVNAVIGTSPASVSTASGTATISISSGTANNGYILVADGAGGTIWNPASTSGLTSVVGVSPISSVVSGGTVSVSLNANYQTAGIYASSVSATLPISATLSTAGVLSLSIDPTLTTAESARRTRSLVRNSTVSTITKGSFVYIDGSNGTVPTIQNALANADATSSRTFGIVEADIASNADGYVTNQGLITGIDTSGFADGAVLWLSPTIAGAATTTKPAGPQHGVLLGIVVKGGSVGAGSIYVFIKNGAELDEIHDVNISGVANGDILIYSSTASVWQNQTFAAAGLQPAGTYVNAVVGTSPASVSTTSGTSTVSIVAGSINSTHLSASSVGSSQLIAASINSTHLASNAVVASAIAAAAVNTAKIDSTGGSSGWVLTANGAGAATFSALGAATDTTKIALSVITAKGDLVAGSAASTAVAVSIGSNGKILAANSSVAAGISWINNRAGGKNVIDNGDFAVAQRIIYSAYTSLSANTGTTSLPCGFDRWRINSIGGTGGSFRVAASSATYFGTDIESNANGGPAQYARFWVASSTSTTSQAFVEQRLRGSVNTLENQTVTLSAWIRGTTTSSLSKVEHIQYFGSGGTPTATNITTIASSPTISTTWTRYAWTFTIPSISAATFGTNANDWACIRFTLGPANGLPEINLWGVQLEAGSVATDFQLAHGSWSNELMNCRRYAQVFSNVGTSTAAGLQTYGFGVATTTSAVNANFILSPSMVAKPDTYEVLGTNDPGIFYGGSSATASNSILNPNGCSKEIGCLTLTTTGATIGAFAIIRSPASTATVYGFYAEL